MQNSTLLYPIDKHGWTELLPKREANNPWSSRSAPNSVPWVVVGAGFTGLQCARRLAQLHPNDEIVLLEAREIGQASSGRNSGYAVGVSQFGGPFDGANRNEYERVNRINRIGLGLLGEQVAEHEIECDWNASGFFHTAADEKSALEFDYFKTYLEELNISHSTLEQSQLKAKLGTDHYLLGLHVHEGALVQPAGLVRGLALSLPENVSVYENSTVLQIKDGKKPVVEMGDGCIRTEKLILATNFEVTNFSLLKRSIIGSTLSGSFTRRLTQEERQSLGSLREWGVLSLHGGGATVRLTCDGRICLRNTAEYHGGQLLSERDLGERQVVHRKSFELRFPQLKHVPFEFGWSGVEGISRNMTNFFGHQGQNTFYAGGYNGSGVSRGTAFGHALAEYASDVDSSLVSDCMASKKARWIPPRPILDLGAVFTVKSRFRGVGKDR